MSTYQEELKALAAAVHARTRGKLRVENIATIERFSFDGDGCALLVEGVSGDRCVIFDNWRATSRTRVSGMARALPDGRIVGLPTRGRLDYDSTPRDSEEWKNVPDKAWEECRRFCAELLALPKV